MPVARSGGKELTERGHLGREKAGGTPALQSGYLMRRWFVRGLIGLALLLGGAALAIRGYLRSDQATARVAAQLEGILGLPVRVGGLDVGMGESTLTGVEVREAGDSVGAEPWIKIDAATADVGLPQLLGGEVAASSLQISGATVLLRFDRNGHLLNKLPATAGPMPVVPPIHIEQSKLILRREGHPDCLFQGLTGDIKVEDNRYLLSGTVNDTAWGGAWSIDGWLRPDSRLSELNLKTGGVRVTQEMLNRVPFVSPNVWAHFNADGFTPADVKLRFGQPNRRCHYRVALRLSETSVYVSSIDLRASQTNGIAVIEDGYVVLREVKGKTADGTLILSASDLNFREPVRVFTFTIEAQRLNLQGLPKSWKLPPRLGGYLSGKADLTVRVVNNKPVPLGAGEGRVDQAVIAFVPIPGYGLRIQADGNGFRFEPTIKR